MIKKTNEFYKGYLKGLNVALAGQTQKPLNSDREFLKKMYKTIKEELGKEEE